MKKKSKLQEKDIYITDLWNLFLQRFWIMVLGAVLCMAVVISVNTVTYTPRYESKATLYILRQGETENVNDASAELSLSLKVVNDCTYFLKSHTVLDEVIQSLDLNMSYSQLYDCVSTYNPENTRILEVTVEADSPQLAKQIVDKICDIGPDTITGAMGYEQVQLFENGTQASSPCNKTSVLVYLMLGIATAAAIYCVFLILFLVDDRLRTDEDIEHILGLSILGNIPNANSNGHSGYGYRYGYGYGQKSSKGKKKEAKK